VTGAGGLTGGAVAGELLRADHEVIGVTRTRASAAMVPDGAEVVVADCRDAAAMRPLLARADSLVHVAGILLASEVASAGLTRLSRVVALSTAGIYSRSRASAPLYAKNEEAIRAAHPRATLVRPTMIYGSPRDRNVHRAIEVARRWRALPVPLGHPALVQPIHYADLALAVARIVDTDASGVIDAGGPDSLGVRDVARAIFHALGLPPRLLPVPLRAAIPLARVVDALTASRWSERLERLREDRTVDNARLLQLTGVRLRGFDEGVREEVAMMWPRA
jgi:uncharacterized protein YbjT (DUF2867 family)